MADDERRTKIEVVAKALDAAARMAKGIHEIRVYDGRSAWDGAEIARSDFLVVENEARAALDRVRDARGDDEGPKKRLVINETYREHRSPQSEDHEPKPYAGQPEWRPELGPPDPPTAHMWGVGGAGPAARSPQREDHEHNTNERDEDHDA